MYCYLNAEIIRKGIAVTDLASELQVAPKTMWLMLNGKSIITLTEAKKIKGLLGIDMKLELLFASKNDLVV